MCPCMRVTNHVKKLSVFWANSVKIFFFKDNQNTIKMSLNNQAENSKVQKWN